MSDTQLIKDKLDIVDFISEYVQLKPAGVNHKGLCPFHHEKSPSFMVTRERQSWHCFGCAKGGDIFSFIQEIEGMEFREALKFLANRAGVELQDKGSNKEESTQKTRVKEINHAAANFFHNVLTQLPAAEAARAYVQQRGLSEKTITDWLVGFIPDQWELLTKYLLKKGFGIDDLVASGLTIKRDSADRQSGRGYYDRFRGRVMFPIWDVHDSIVGFTGRVLVETENSGGKYVNTPQTVAYDKSRVIFGLNKAKRAIKEKDLAVLVEGQMDVIACHQAGMTNVVATSGTALTEHQIEMLKRYTQNLAMAFDADAAGQNAAKRGIDLAREAGLSVRVIRIPEGAGKDPDECIKKDPAVWAKAVAEARDVMEWFIEKSLLNRDIRNPRDRQTAVNEILVEVGRIPYALERDLWLKNVSARLGEEISVLRENLLELRKNEKKITPRTTPEPVAVAKPVTPDRLTIMANRLLALQLKFLGANLTINWGNPILDSVYQNSEFAGLYLFIKKQYTAGVPFSLDELRHACATSSSENIVDVLLLKGEMDFFEFSSTDAQSEARVLQETLTQEGKKRRMTALSAQIKEAELTNDTARLNQLLAEFNQII